MRRDKNIKKEKKNWNLKESMIESLQLPKDLMLGMPIVTVTGFHEAYIENYKGILEYSEEMILLQTKTCQIEIQGEKLHIMYYTNDEMKVEGMISSIQYFNYS